MEVLPAPGRRRTSEEIRGLILAAAKEQFIANGYAATRTEDIAKQAGVQQRLLYTNFGSKRELFEASVIEPVRNVISDYLQVKHDESLPIQERLRVLIEGLYEIAWTNRVVLRAVLVLGDDDGAGTDLLDAVATSLQRTLGPVSEHPDVDSTAAMIDLAGMVFGVALLESMLVPRGTRKPSRARLLDEMNKMASYRLLYNKLGG